MSSVNEYGVQKEGREEVKFRKKLKLWRLRESEVKEEFAKGVSNKCDGNEDYLWLYNPKHFEMWLLNKDVNVAVCKRELFRIWKQSRNEEDRKKYCEAKKMLRE